MAAPVCDGARMQCSYGQGEATLRVDQRGVTHHRDGAQATIDDCVPLVNIPPFHGCVAPANPSPSTPGGNKPCTPRFSQQWSDEVDFILLQGKKLLEQRATLTCDYAGTIRLLDTAQEISSFHEDLLRNPGSFVGAAGGAMRGGSAKRGGV